MLKYISGAFRVDAMFDFYTIQKLRYFKDYKSSVYNWLISHASPVAK